jgi:hypothetical protein
MSGLHKATKKFDPLGHAVVESMTGIDKQEKDIARSRAAQTAYEQSQAARAAELESRRGVQVETRQQNVAAAAAAGATRIASDTDLLGKASGTKRRYASRTLLGE